MAPTKIKEVTASDVTALKQVIDASELFPSEYVDDMIAPYLADHDSDEIWFVCYMNDRPVGFVYCVPERLTDGTYNLLAMGVSKAHQRQGIGGEMMAHIEEKLRTMGKRLLVVDTSGTDEFMQARSFYTKAGYKNVATIKDFWKDGDDKVTFCKRLL